MRSQACSPSSANTDLTKSVLDADYTLEDKYRRTQGRIYLSAGDGGLATPLTGSDYLSQRPLWSPDGKQIAFAANLYGNEDVFVVPSEGGEMVRLTQITAPSLRKKRFSAV